MADVRPELSSSRLFSVGTENLSGGVVSSSTLNYMTKSYADNEYLEDSGLFGVIAPVIYQLDLLKEDVDDVYSQISQSQYTKEVKKFNVTSTETASIAFIDTSGGTTASGDFSFGGSLLPQGNKGQVLGSAKKRWSKLYVASEIDASGSLQISASEGTQVTGSLLVSGSDTFQVVGPTSFTGSFAQTDGDIESAGSITGSSGIKSAGELVTTGDFTVGADKFVVNSSTGTGTFVGGVVAAVSEVNTISASKFVPKGLTAEIGDAKRRIEKIYMKSQIIHSGSLHIGTDQSSETDGVVVSGSLLVSGSETFRVEGPSEFTGSFSQTDGDIDSAGSITGSGGIKSEGELVTTGDFTVGSDRFTVNSSTGTGTFTGAMIAATSSTDVVKGNKFIPKNLTAEIGTAEARITKLYMKSTIDVSGSLHIQPDSTISEEDFNVVVSGSIVPGNLDTGSIGTLAEPFKDLYVQSGSIRFCDVSKTEGDKDWGKMSDQERKGHSTRFGKEEIDMLYRGETLNASGHMSASGNMHVVGQTILEGVTHLEGAGHVHGLFTTHGSSSFTGHNDFGGQTRMLGDNYLLGNTDLIGQFKLTGTRVTSNASELNLLDGIRSGTVTNSKVPVYGSSGELNATTLQIGGTSITATPTELNKMRGVTVTTANINSVTSKLGLSGGQMTGLIQLPSSTITSINKGIVDCRQIDTLEISMKGSSFSLEVATPPPWTGAKLTIISRTAGAIVHAQKLSQPGQFQFAAGRNLTCRAGAAYQFVLDSDRVWRHIIL